MPAPARLRRLKISRAVAWYMVSRGIPFPDCPPMVKTPEPENDKTAFFSFERVDRVMSAFRVLRHTKGEYAGQPLEPAPWQVAYIIAPVFGWVRKNSRGNWARIIRNVYVDVPRKNGKSTLCGGLAIYLTAADGEAGAEVVTAATSRDQAGMVFKPIKLLAQKSPGLKGRVRAVGNTVLHPKTDSVLTAISASGDSQHGSNLHGAIVDELHLHKTPDLVEAIETGTGARHQPLIVKITTADDGKPQSIYSRNRHYVEQLAKGIFKDGTHYGVVFAVPREADPFSEKTWKAANPNYPVSPTREFMQAAANKAKNSPVDLAAFKRLHLGIRTKQTTEFIGLVDWRKNEKYRVDEDQLLGRQCYGGLDLGSVSDLTALCWLFPNGGGGYDALWRFWTPEENLVALDERTANSASQWVKDGWLHTTPGDVTDYDYIKKTILDDRDKFEVTSIGFDRWNATQLGNDLMAADVPMVKVGQGFMTLSPALKEAQRLVLKGRRDDSVHLNHGGNPIMAWMIDNLSVATDPAGNVKPDKATSAEKIDGVSALCTALAEALAGNQTESAYNDHDLLFA